MQRAMAAEAEASREANATFIAAEGEKNASVVMKEAGDVMSQCPLSIQLRCLQTLNTVAANDNSTITFPLPIDLLFELFDVKENENEDADGLLSLIQ
ncbi:hypothetical protein B4U80_07842 [Leptotrombidium deliense]|uniref:Uncharacterized protein n=1 Tax=Leptotrombidium deliense TaxID=299467 RepID=A0A443S305_9ACAR|nr:hypothetical protein B4U80_07842 [Leptotrombidium deliense]